MTEKKSTYNYEAQKKYNEKNVVISLKFIHSEKSFLDSIEKACHNTGMSRQKYIKDAIKEKLKNVHNFVKLLCLLCFVMWISCCVYV